MGLHNILEGVYLVNPSLQFFVFEQTEKLCDVVVELLLGFNVAKQRCTCDFDILSSENSTWIDNISIC